MAQYKPIKPIKNADTEQFQPTDDQRYWMQMQEAAVFEESVSFIGCDFRPQLPYHLATVHGTKLTVFEAGNCEEIASYSRFKAPLTSVKYREDGALLGVSTHNGQLQFFNVHTAAEEKSSSTTKNRLQNPIRTFSAHQCRAGGFDFDPSGMRVASFADDGRVKLFDLSTDNSDPLWDGKAHTDSIRTAAFLRGNEHMLATGSYDHTVRLWDTRQDSTETQKFVCKFKHDFPVEKLLHWHQPNMLIVACSTFVHFWDLRAEKLFHKLEVHRKTITSLCLAHDDNFLLSGGADRRINVHRLDQSGGLNFDKVHSFKAAAPVLSLAISGEDNSMAFGAGKQLAIFRRMKNEKEDEEKQPERKKRRKQKHEFLEDLPVKLEPTSQQPVGPVIVERERRGVFERKPLELTGAQLEKLNLGKFDHLLRTGNLRELVAKIVSTQQKVEPEYAVAVFQQIRVRQELDYALSEQSMPTLGSLANFLREHLFEAAFFDILYDVLNKTIAIYTRTPLNRAVSRAFRSLQKRLAHEIGIQNQLGQTIGAMKMILAAHRNQREEEEEQQREAEKMEEDQNQMEKPVENGVDQEEEDEVVPPSPPSSPGLSSSDEDNLESQGEIEKFY